MAGAPVGAERQMGSCGTFSVLSRWLMICQGGVSPKPRAKMSPIRMPSLLEGRLLSVQGLGQFYFRRRRTRKETLNHTEPVSSYGTCEDGVSANRHDSGCSTVRRNCRKITARGRVSPGVRTCSGPFANR